MKKIENLILLFKTVKNFWVVLAILLGYRPISLKKLVLKNGMSIYIRPRTTDFHEVISVLSGRDYSRELINRHLPQKPLVINIGAHIGCFDMFIKSLRPLAHIWSYEPNPNNFSLLCRNIKENHLKHIVLTESAVGSAVGFCDLCVNELNPNESSLFGSGKKELVKCINLQMILKSTQAEVIDLLKMDCEGCEYDIIRNFPKKVVIRNVLMEYHNLSSTKTKSFVLKHMNILGYSLEFEQELFESLTGVLWFQLRQS